MAKLTDLPNELLLQILDSLSRRDTLSLCRVAPPLNGICQSSLLHSVYLTDPHRQLPSLIRILVQRPELRSFLRNFSTPTSLGHVVRVTDWPHLVTEAKKHATALGFKKPPWFIALQSGFVPACIGLVLLLASRLEGLDLQRGNDGVVSVECMFSRPMHKRMRLTSFPFHNTLKTLGLSYKVLDGRCLHLPKLHTLTLDYRPQETETALQFDQRASFTIENLVLNCSTLIFQQWHSWQPQVYYYLSSLVQLFPNLKHIQIAYTNWEQKKTPRGDLYWHQHMYDGYRKGFTCLTKHLQLVCSSLESLEIVSLDHRERDFSPHLMPIDTLRHFANLKYLRVPHAALVNAKDLEYYDYYGHQQQPPLPPIQVLPASLETLVVSGPRPQTLEWLALLLEYRNERPEFKEIILDFLNDPSNGLGAFKCSEESPVILFHDAEIRICVRNVSSEFYPINRLDNYIFGPFSMED